jgi:hypothetical protein
MGLDNAEHLSLHRVRRAVHCVQLHKQPVLKQHGQEDQQQQHSPVFRVQPRQQQWAVPGPWCLRGADVSTHHLCITKRNHTHPIAITATSVNLQAASRSLESRSMTLRVPEAAPAVLHGDGAPVAFDQHNEVPVKACLTPKELYEHIVEAGALVGINQHDYSWFLCNALESFDYQAVYVHNAQALSSPSGRFTSRSPWA